MRCDVASRVRPQSHHMNTYMESHATHLLRYKSRRQKSEIYDSETDPELL